MLSKAPTFEGYILSCKKRLHACSRARPLRTSSYLWLHTSIDEKREDVKDVCDLVRLLPCIFSFVRI
jgi:hypothetical protein